MMSGTPDNINETLPIRHDPARPEFTLAGGQSGRYEMLSDEGTARVSGAWEYLLEYVEAATRALLTTDDPNAAAYSGGTGEQAYSDLELLANGQDQAVAK